MLSVWPSACVRADEKEDEIDEAILKKMKQKQKQKEKLDDERESEPWRKLPTTMVYLKALQRECGRGDLLRFEDAPQEAKDAVRDRWCRYTQGDAGFNKKANEIMETYGVPEQRSVTAPVPGKPTVQPYQQTVSWFVHPLSIRNPRLLVAHRTGAGKTCSMIRIFDNFFSDLRPKIAIFPTTAVCNNFYMELLDPKFPNRYAEWLAREDKIDDVRKSLEMAKGVLKSGRVTESYRLDPLRPSAPLRAFSYTQAGGRQSCGERHSINPVFKCPDGYAGGWDYSPGETHDPDGYEEFTSDGNPFSNKIILMDEVQNLLQPSPEIQKSKTRVLMLDRLKSMLATCTNSVVVGFTATPLVGEPSSPSSKPLLDVIKGSLKASALDEGFSSYFMSTPTAVFPQVKPSGIPSCVPEALFRRVPLRNFALPDESPMQVDTDGVDGDGAGSSEKKKKKKKTDSRTQGNLSAYLAEREKNGDSSTKLGPLCSIGQHYSSAGQYNGPIMCIRGHAGKLLKYAFNEDTADTGYQFDRADGFCTKLAAICDDLDGSRDKTLVLVHAHHGFKLLLRLLCSRYGKKSVVGYPPSKVKEEDVEMKRLLGERHDSRATAQGRPCPCNLCIFNNRKANLRGEERRIIVADAKECSEGVSFLGVRRMLIVDVPSTAIEYIQRVGRVVRFAGHAGLNPDERNVQVKLYVGTIPTGADDAPIKSADEQQVEELDAGVKEYQSKLVKLRENAFDGGRWDESSGDVPTLLEDDELDFNDSDPVDSPSKPASSKPHAVSKPATSLATSKFKRLYDKVNMKPTCDEIWTATQCLVEHYVEDQDDAKRFVKMLKREPLFQNGETVTYSNIDEPKQLAVLLWSSVVNCNGRELCSLLNQCIRDDDARPETHEPLRSAVLLTRAINRVTVTADSKRLNAVLDTYNWPSGPNAELGQSDEKDVTWRGGALPAEHLQFFKPGKQFRSNMFLATSFDKSVATGNFMDPIKPGSRVLWKFKFEHRNCKHVNFLGGDDIQSAVKSEREFLLSPYSIFTVASVLQSDDVETEPHFITLNVAPDNKLDLDAEELPLAPWG